MAVRQGVEPWVLAYAGFQDRYFRPLSHLTRRTFKSIIFNTLILKGIERFGQNLMSKMAGIINTK